jgi:hypothetical protein
MDALIDDCADPARAANGAVWELVRDGVMGGVSSGALRHEVIDGRAAWHLTGRVSLANNGGFVQMALDLAPGGGPIDARGYAGLAVTLRGDGGEYGVHLRTTAVTRPWQSWRAVLPTGGAWRRHELPFTAFAPHRIDAPLDPGRLRRIGIVAIGRPGPVDVALADLRFFS